MLDIIACGELLIDFVSTESGVSLAQAPAFVKAAGGAPANVAVGVARLGYRAGFMGQVGDDDFGHYLADTLSANGVNTDGLCFSSEARTALAFVSLRADGERDFMFYRNPSADMLWRPEDVAGNYAASTRIFHYGSISLIGEPSRSATLEALESARSGGALISYDPNLRMPLWRDPIRARNGILDGMAYADLVKVSEEELFFLTGQEDMGAAQRCCGTTACGCWWSRAGLPAAFTSPARQCARSLALRFKRWIPLAPGMASLPGCWQVCWTGVCSGIARQLRPPCASATRSAR